MNNVKYRRLFEDVEYFTNWTKRLFADPNANRSKIGQAYKDYLIVSQSWGHFDPNYEPW